MGTNYTPVGKVDINAIRKEAATKPTQPPQPVTTRPLGVGQKWSKPATTGFQSKYAPPPPVKPTPAPDDDWEPTPAPVKLTPAPPLPTATRPTPPAPAVSMNDPHPYRNAPTNFSHSPLRKRLSQPSLLPSLLRKIASDLLERTGNQYNSPSLRDSSIRSKDAHKKRCRNSNSKPNHQLRSPL